MKILFVFCGALYFSTFSWASAATLGMDAHGRQFTITEWSEPHPIVVASDMRELHLTKQEAQVRISEPGQPEKIGEEQWLDLIYDSEGTSVWIGNPHEAYFSLGKTIFGVKGSGTSLQIRASKDAKGKDIQSVAGEALGDLIKDSRLFRAPESAVSWIELDLIFTYDALAPKRSAGGWSQLVKVNGVRLVDDSVILELASLVNSDMQLVLSRDLKVESAFIGGESVMIIRDGQHPSALPDWGQPRERVIPSDRGPIKVLSCVKINDVAGGSYGLRAVASRSGHFWIGSDQCRLALLGGRMLGIFLDPNSRKLHVYEGPREVLPLTGKTSVAFESAIVKFEESFSRSGLKGDFVVEIQSLFPGDFRLSSATEMDLREVICEGAALVICLRTYEPRADWEIKISPELKVLSALEVDLPKQQLSP